MEKENENKKFKKRVDEEQIIQHIEENRAKEPELSPVPNPVPDIDESRVEEIYNMLDDEFVVSSFFDKDEVMTKIIEYNYDYEKMKEYIENNI